MTNPYFLCFILQIIPGIYCKGCRCFNRNTSFTNKTQRIILYFNNFFFFLLYIKINKKKGMPLNYHSGSQGQRSTNILNMINNSYIWLWLACSHSDREKKSGDKIFIHKTHYIGWITFFGIWQRCFLSQNLGSFSLKTSRGTTQQKWACGKDNTQELDTKWGDWVKIVENDKTEQGIDKGDSQIFKL